MSYSIHDIRQIVKGLRVLYPTLEINQVINNIEKAVEEFGVDVQYSNFENESDPVSGFLMYEKNKPVIVLNAGESVRRQRFTLAHELGHLILHWNWLPGEQVSDLNEDLFEISYRNKKDYKKDEMIRENEADTFAGEFLLPLDSVKDSLKSVSSDSVIATLMEDFKVSQSCAYVRVNNLLREGELSE
ncbi:hypothetical protein B7935_10315 [Streptococcus agalactiae]|uniref:ImmA/IrrE family metallo-endopeptidase n=1 Tax=Streptococcus agalactiae TaxID=1311 RepID=UPI000A331871|nr:ImmA/IrrE family metallo-endopeptidase [Streptococcus agalactiae]OTG44176.1 hypothetical protein B7936_09680 [Streptococcus agalactiae]OTG44817.1 hypothetical protein B7935_10315 [Streptococcus agalactiae]RRA84733.1 ImmA/IrrE family metallo-endopeptidase [Streptococcus agalactiae]